MKKRQFVLIFLMAVVFLASIVPSLAARLYAESQNTAFCVALEANSTLRHFEKEAYSEVLKAYKESGVTVAAITEENLAFDEAMISLAENNGLFVALLLDGTCEKPAAFYDSLETLLNQHDIQYIGVQNRDAKKQIPVSIKSFLKQSDMTLLVMEKMSQLSNEQFIGYDEAVSAADGRIMRCYETWKEPAKTISAGNQPVDYADVLYHQMLNSAKDRNTRFILVNQIISGTDNPFSQATQTQTAVKAFTQAMAASGYDTKAVPDYSDYLPSHKVTSAGAASIGVLMVLFMIHIVFKKSSAILDYIFLALSVCAFAVTLFLPEQLIRLYPTAYAVLAGCFSLTACAYLADKLKEKIATPFWFTIIMLLATLGTLVLSGSVLLALLSGADYYLNNLIFRGVKLTLLAPIAYAAVMLWLFYSRKTVKEQLLTLPRTAKETIANIRIYHIILVALVGVAGALYLMRSGNSGISLWENQFRNFLSELSGARPRTKEFLIGWPCLALWMYYLKKDSGLCKWVFGVGASLLFASVTNTFCHVFTDGCISLLRTVNGLLFSLPVIGAVSAGNVFIRKLIKQFKQ